MSNEYHIGHTQWWNELCHGIYGPRKGGARIVVDAQDAETGAGKTGLAVSLAMLLAKAFDYEIQTEDLTLSGAHYLERWRDHPGEHQPSVIILDEMGGAGAGHARRSMSHQNVNLGNAWQLMRKKRIVSIVTLPHWSKLDKDLKRQADYRLHCQKHPIGYFKPYSVGVSFDAGDVQTHGYDDVPPNGFPFPNLDEHNDPLFAELGRMKDELLDSAYFDADRLKQEKEDPGSIDPDAARREEKIETAQRLRNKGFSTREVADIVKRSQTWVSDNTDSEGGGQSAA